MINNLEKYTDYRRKFLEQYRKISKQMENYEEKFSMILDKKYFELCFFCKFHTMIPDIDGEDFDSECEQGRFEWLDKDEPVHKCGYFRNRDGAFIDLNSMHIRFLEEIIEDTDLK